MKTFTMALTTALGLIVSTGADASVVLRIASSDPDASIQFLGDGSKAKVMFVSPAATPGFNVTTTKVDGVSTPNPGMIGSISGAFEYVRPLNTPGTQYASLTGSGTLTLTTSGSTLTATITGVEIYSSGAIGGINTQPGGVINIIGASLSGPANAILSKFASEVNSGSGVGSISYTFEPEQFPVSLYDLAANGSNKSTTYAGTLSSKANAVPEPGTFGMAISGVALLSLGYYRQRRLKLA